MAESTKQSYYPWYSNLLGGKKLARRQKLTKISYENLAVVDELVAEIKRLEAKKQHAEADRLIKITQKVLDNNKKFQDVVVEILADSD